MKAPRILAALTACFSLSLLACGGGEPTAESAETQAPLSSVEQGIGIPPVCASGDSLIYWTENVQACVLKCGTTRVPGQPSTLYAACQSNVSGTKTLINVRHCIPGCNPIE